RRLPSRCSWRRRSSTPSPRPTGRKPSCEPSSRKQRRRSSGRRRKVRHCVLVLVSPAAPPDAVPPDALGGATWLVEGAAGAVELPLLGAVEAEASVGSFHSGIFFTSSAVFEILKASFCPSHLNSSTGSATRWAPTPSTPPSLTTRRSIFF